MKLPQIGEFWTLGRRFGCPHDYLPAVVQIEYKVGPEDTFNTTHGSTKETIRELIECGCLGEAYRLKDA